MPHPNVDDYKSNFEREFFMVVNLLRDNPSSFGKYVKDFVARGHAPGHPSVSVIVDKKLKATPNLKPVELDGIASKACYVNLTKNINQSVDELIDAAAGEYKKTQTNMS